MHKKNIHQKLKSLKISPEQYKPQKTRLLKTNFAEEQANRDTLLSWLIDHRFNPHNLLTLLEKSKQLTSKKTLELDKFKKHNYDITSESALNEQKTQEIRAHGEISIQISNDIRLELNTLTQVLHKEDPIKFEKIIIELRNISNDMEDNILTTQKKLIEADQKYLPLIRKYKEELETLRKKIIQENINIYLE